MTLNGVRHLASYIVIKELFTEHPEYSIRAMCGFLGISTAAYYKWKNRMNSKNDDLNERIAEKVIEIHGEHPDMGDRRIGDTLAHDYEFL